MLFFTLLRQCFQKPQTAKYPKSKWIAFIYWLIAFEFLKKVPSWKSSLNQTPKQIHATKILRKMAKSKYLLQSSLNGKVVGPTIGKIAAEKQIWALRLKHGSLAAMIRTEMET